MDIIYPRGGKQNAPGVAKEAGMFYGVRHDYTAYGKVFFLDINWKKYDWSKYLEKVRALRPVMAMTPDYESATQRRALYGCIRDLKSTDVERIMVCPKFTGAIAHIPKFCIVALSAPAPTYATFLPDLRECTGRKIHLLGSNPHTQIDLIRKLRGIGAEPVSVDGNYLAMKAAKGSYFQHGRWVDIRRQGVSTEELEIVSARNILNYLRENEHQVQPMLI